MRLKNGACIAVTSLVAFMGFVGSTVAQAADLGGSCCADLEERIAELEATAARKGNRNVSLTISGWVAEQVVHWNDGVESNTYVTGLGTAFASNIRIAGEARISSDVKAGYLLHIEAIGSDVYSTNADRPVGPGLTGSPNSTQVLYSYWYLKSDAFGQVSIGKQSQADDNVIVSLDGSGTLAAAYWVGYDVFGFNVRGNFAPGTSVSWGNASSCRGWGGGPGDCDGLPRNVVRYDTPAIAGFSAGASWGEDDEWAVLGRYNNIIGNVKIAAAVSYGETNDENIAHDPGRHAQVYAGRPLPAAHAVRHLRNRRLRSLGSNRQPDEQSRHRHVVLQGWRSPEPHPDRRNHSLRRISWREQQRDD